jgi:hypothetical protein
MVWDDATHEEIAYVLRRGGRDYLRRAKAADDLNVYI